MIEAYSHEIEEQMQEFYNRLPEKFKRLYAGIEAFKLSYGGITYIAELFKCSRNTVQLGVEELSTEETLPQNRNRKKGDGAPCYLTKFRDSCHLNSLTYAANGRCPECPASVTTTHKSRFVITPSNGWTAIRNAILASLARYRALRISELPCRLSGTKNHHFAIAPFP